MKLISDTPPGCGFPRARPEVCASLRPPATFAQPFGLKTPGSLKLRAPEGASDLHNVLAFGIRHVTKPKPSRSVFQMVLASGLLLLALGCRSTNESKAPSWEAGHDGWRLAGGNRSGECGLDQVSCSGCKTDLLHGHLKSLRTAEITSH